MVAKDGDSQVIVDESQAERTHDLLFVTYKTLDALQTQSFEVELDGGHVVRFLHWVRERGEVSKAVQCECMPLPDLWNATRACGVSNLPLGATQGTHRALGTSPATRAIALATHGVWCAVRATELALVAACAPPSPCAPARFAILRRNTIDANEAAHVAKTTLPA